MRRRERRIAGALIIGLILLVALGLTRAPSTTTIYRTFFRDSVQDTPTGGGRSGGGVARAPIPDPTPEPSEYGMAAAGMLIIAAVVRRVRRS